MECTMQIPNGKHNADAIYNANTKYNADIDIIHDAETKCGA